MHEGLGVVVQLLLECENITTAAAPWSSMRRILSSSADNGDAEAMIGLLSSIPMYFVRRSMILSFFVNVSLTVGSDLIHPLTGKSLALRVAISS
jgi:hypothetical protein